MTNFMRRTGTPCWLDLQTDVERARAFYGAALGLDTSAATAHADELTLRFCRDYDEKSFDRAFAHRPLAFFAPLVATVFARPPYWHSPEHPKRGLVTG